MLRKGRCRSQQRASEILREAGHRRQRRADRDRKRCASVFAGLLAACDSRRQCKPWMRWQRCELARQRGPRGGPSGSLQHCRLAQSEPNRSRLASGTSASHAGTSADRRQGRRRENRGPVRTRGQLQCGEIARAGRRSLVLRDTTRSAVSGGVQEKRSLPERHTRRLRDAAHPFRALNMRHSATSRSRGSPRTRAPRRPSVWSLGTHGPPRDRAGTSARSRRRPVGRAGNVGHVSWVWERRPGSWRASDRQRRHRSRADCT